MHWTDLFLPLGKTKRMRVNFTTLSKERKKVRRSEKRKKIKIV